MPHEGGAQGPRQAAMSELQGALSDRGWDPRDADRGRKARVRNALGGALVVARVFGRGASPGVPNIRRYFVAGERAKLLPVKCPTGDSQTAAAPPDVGWPTH